MVGSTSQGSQSSYTVSWPDRDPGKVQNTHERGTTYRLFVLFYLIPCSSFKISLFVGQTMFLTMEKYLGIFGYPIVCRPQDTSSDRSRQSCQATG